MYKKGEEMSKEEAVQLLTAAGYKAKVENSVVIARVENFTKKEFEKVRKILKDAGYKFLRILRPGHSFLPLSIP